MFLTSALVAVLYYLEKIPALLFPSMRGSSMYSGIGPRPGESI